MTKPCGKNAGFLYHGPKPKKENPHCSHCNSSDVLFDAYAEWNSEKQEFIIQNVMDKGHYCNECQGECSIVWRNKK